ncbi:MAG TPA: hypothetical protein VGN88_11550 [Phycisphaerae bacterium]|jgi:hypothetical protein
MSIASNSLRFTGFFEAEVLTELLLWRWDHPLKNDAEFRNGLLEDAAAALQDAVDGQNLFDDLPPPETNLVAAIYFAEWSAITSAGEDPHGLRRNWLENFRATIPSCFHSQGDLPP